MYYDYFGLKQPPFRITPDTSLFFPGGDRGAVLDALIYAILNGEGMVKVVGEVGSGKTMLCRMLEKELPDKVEVVYLANPSLSPENILHAIAFELKLSVQAETSRLQVMRNLQEYLMKRHAENRQVVVFVEEAQAMPIATLEEIRLLSNLETQQSKLLQLVLFGQPELDELIARKEIRQLKERITYSFQLNPFMSENIRDYVNSRLRSSGYRSGEIFNKRAIRKIEYYSRGLLRRVNILADKSLLAAYAGNTDKVTARHVEQAARDSEFVTHKARFLWITGVTASVLLVMLVLMGLWQLESGKGGEMLGRQTQAPFNATAGLEARAVAGGPVRPPQAEAVPARISVGTKTVTEPASKAAQATADLVKTGSSTQPRDELQLSLDESIRQASGMKSTTIKAVGAEVKLSAEKDLTLPAQARLEGQIMGLSTLLELQDLGDTRLSGRETELLRKQLKALPPEVALYEDSTQFSDICKLCWSILYRPLVDPENL